ncbi:FAD-dependent oxidoreductase [Neisseriaceae bacterium TC5R-5]|nr:FAD-dependent oxidoreductase [Neisseriaceae bacterium TC5R-5]
MSANERNDVGIVIVGGGQAAGWAAKTLRDQGYAGRLSIVSDEPYDFYERPPLSKDVLLSDSHSPPFCALFPESTVQALQLCWYRPQRAVQLDINTQQILLDSGEWLPFTQLLLATGARPHWPDPSWQQHPQVLSLRSWEDAQRLRQQLKRCRSLALLGGGWIGLEIAAAARQLGLSVSLFERAERLCSRSAAVEVSQYLARLQQQHGVTLHTGCQTLRLDLSQAQPRIRTPQTETEAFDLLLVGTGVELNLELARQAGLAIRQGVVVDGQGRSSHPAVFAAGDIAEHPQLGVCLQSWAYAQNQAITTARAMLDAQASPYDEPAWLWSDQYDVNIQLLGLPAPDLQCVQRHSIDSSLFFYLNEQQQLVHMVACNDGRAIKLGKRWLQSGRVLDAAQLSDPDCVLMSLR